MTDNKTVKATLIVTNHFKELPVNPKIVYANKYMLNLSGYDLEEITNQEPQKLFANWNNDSFIQEIVSCVDKKIDWVGELQVITHSGSMVKKIFQITPIYNANNEISYYACSTNSNCSLCEKVQNSNLICLDDYICSLVENQNNYQTIFETAPENLLKIDLNGNIIFANAQSQNHFKLIPGDNIFKLMKNSSKRIQSFFKNKNVKGKVSKIDFEINSNNQVFPVHCKFWLLTDDNNNAVGYSISLSDMTRRLDIAKKILELKGV